MITIRKRSHPAQQKICGILRTNSPDVAKKPRRSVGFADTIGKPLVNYRYLPTVEENSRTTDNSGDHHHHHHEKTSGKYISHHVEKATKWQLLPVKNARKPKPKTEMTKMEEQRLEDANISRAPLFGTFETIETLNLITDAILRARAPVPVIPLFGSNTPLAAHHHSHTYEQVFEDPTAPAAAAAKPMDVLTLMAQLKQRGLIPNGSAATAAADEKKNVGLATTPTQRWAAQGGGGGWKNDKTCLYFVNRPNGCDRGDLCRFQHSEELREHRQRDLQQKQQRSDSPKDENWRRPNQYQPKFDGRSRRIGRNRSPPNRRNN